MISVELQTLQSCGLDCTPDIDKLITVTPKSRESLRFIRGLCFFSSFGVQGRFPMGVRVNKLLLHATPSPAAFCK